MTSRDGYNFKRWDEAFVSAGPERLYNWCYGDGYAAYGLIETKSGRAGGPNELSIYVPTNYWSVPREIERFVIRVDGFFSYGAPYSGGWLLTKPMIYSGSTLSLNFATSAFGGITATITDDAGGEYRSYPIFGDSLDRKVAFEGLDLGALSGKPVRLRFDMSDARVYSFKFE